MFHRNLISLWWTDTLSSNRSWAVFCFQMDTMVSKCNTNKDNLTFIQPMFEYINTFWYLNFQPSNKTIFLIILYLFYQHKNCRETRETPTLNLLRSLTSVLQPWRPFWKQVVPVHCHVHSNQHFPLSNMQPWTPF